MSDMIEIPFEIRGRNYTLRIGPRLIGLSKRFMCRIDDADDMLVVNCYWKHEYLYGYDKKSVFERMDMNVWLVDPIDDMQEVVWKMLCDWSEKEIYKDDDTPG